MKACKCGNDEFNVVLTISAVVSPTDDDAEVKIIKNDSYHPDSEMIGDIICTECDEVYENWEDVPVEEPEPSNERPGHDAFMNI